MEIFKKSRKKIWEKIFINPFKLVHQKDKTIKITIEDISKHRYLYNNEYVSKYESNK